MLSMKKKALTIVLAMATMLAHAETAKSLYVSFNDGTKVEFALATTPNISFADDKMTVNTTSTTATYELWKVTTYTYSDNATAINNVTSSSTTDFSVEGDYIIIEADRCNVSAYAINGTATNVATTTVGGKTVVDLGSLERGTYIVKIDDKAIKITRL